MENIGKAGRQNINCEKVSLPSGTTYERKTQEDTDENSKRIDWKSGKRPGKKLEP
jgi:hypothetical protein